MGTGTDFPAAVVEKLPLVVGKSVPVPDFAYSLVGVVSPICHAVIRRALRRRHT